MEGQWVMIAVRCMGKACSYCPDLEIVTEVMTFTNEDGEDSCEVNPYCRNLSRCVRIREMMEKEKT